MSYELTTSIGIFVIYNRKMDQNPEIQILGDEWIGTGCWHFGWKDGDQFRVGFESAEEAQEAAESYEWAVVEEQGWP